MIQEYEFGKMVIDNKEYKHDVRIFPDKIKDWWRKEGHSVCKEDLQEVVAAKPELIIFGQGHEGRMEVPEEIKTWLEQQGMKVIIKLTNDAVEEYNKVDKEKTIACLHLTC